MVSDDDTVSDSLSVLATEFETECDVPKDSERETAVDVPRATLVDCVSDSDSVVPLLLVDEDMVVSEEEDMVVSDQP